MFEEVIEEYEKINSNLETISKYIYVNYDKKKFFLEISIGFLFFLFYALICFVERVGISINGIIISIILEVLLTISAVIKKNKKSYTMTDQGIEMKRTKILWNNVKRVQRIRNSTSKYSRHKNEILRIISKEIVVDLELVDLNYKKEYIINQIINFWSYSKKNSEIN